MSDLILPENYNLHFCLPKAEIIEIDRLFVKTENQLKIFEYEGEGLDIPSINELRYCGRHLLTALLKNSSEELTKAKNHVKRALYDAFEVTIISNIELVEIFNDDYRLLPVSDTVKDYVALMAKVEEARDFIQNANKDSREQYYDACSAHVDNLIAINRTLKGARGDLNAKLALRRRETLRWIFGIVITITLALCGWAVSVYLKPPSTSKNISPVTSASAAQIAPNSQPTARPSQPPAP